MSDLAVDKESGLVVADFTSDVSGRGSEQLTSEDRTIPWFKLLQGGSPEIKTARTRIPGASPGMFYHTASGELFDGEDGAEILICTTERYFTEWASEANGGGFVGKHDPASPVVREALAYSKQEDIFPPVRPNGNEITDTRYLYILAGKSLEPAVFAISSTKLKPYKDLMAKYHNWRVVNSKGEKVQPPLCSLRVRCRSFDDSRRGHDFMNLIMEPAVDNDLNKSLLSPDDPRVKIGLRVVEDFEASRIKVDYGAEREVREVDINDGAF